MFFGIVTSYSPRRRCNRLRGASYVLGAIGCWFRLSRRRNAGGPVVLNSASASRILSSRSARTAPGHQKLSIEGKSVTVQRADHADCASSQSERRGRRTQVRHSLDICIAPARNRATTSRPSQTTRLRMRAELSTRSLTASDQSDARRDCPWQRHLQDEGRPCLHRGNRRRGRT
jgi:hypothetical protein